MCILRPCRLPRRSQPVGRSVGQPKYDCSYYRQFRGRTVGRSDGWSPQWLKRLYLCHAPMDRQTERPSASEDLASSAVIKTRRRIAELATTRTRGGGNQAQDEEARGKRRGMRGSETCPTANTVLIRHCVDHRDVEEPY